LNKRAAPQRDLFATPPARVEVPAVGLPDGFKYQPDALSFEQELKLAESFSSLTFKPFRFHGYLARRRVVSFGWRYDHAGAQLCEAEPMPRFLLPLREIAAGFAGVPAESLKQVQVSEYTPGAGIDWHRDKPAFKDIIAFSLLAPAKLRFRLRQEEGWKRVGLEVVPRSAYLLRGPARSFWEHSIPPVGVLRYSVTFRNLAARAHY